MKNILVLDGNPKSNSFSAFLCNTYECSAREYSEIRRFCLHQMNFNPSLDCGYDSIQNLETCLVEFQEAALWADHIVIVSPIWWGGLPAKLKGLFDRTFLPNFSFKYVEDSPVPTQLLKGKTSRIILTMDAPLEYTEEQAQPVIEQLDKFTLQFCGIEKAEYSLFGSIISASEEETKNWKCIVSELGARGH